MREYEKLFSAVVGLAVKDAAKKRPANGLGKDQMSALNFLFLDSDIYLEMLNIDIKRFRMALLRESVNVVKKQNNEYGLTNQERKYLYENYKYWYELKTSQEAKSEGTN